MTKENINVNIEKENVATEAVADVNVEQKESQKIDFDFLVKNKVVAGCNDKAGDAMKKIFVEYYKNVDCKSVGYNKLNLQHCDYGYRVRTEKTEDKELKIVDRGFIGLLPEKIKLPESYNIPSDKIVNCFIYGKRTIGFVMLPSGDLIANQNIQKSSDFIVLLYNYMVNMAVAAESLKWVDFLPTGEAVKTVAKSLKDELKTIKTVDDIRADLGF